MWLANFQTNQGCINYWGMWCICLNQVNRWSTQDHLSLLFPLYFQYCQVICLFSSANHLPRYLKDINNVQVLALLSTAQLAWENCGKHYYNFSNTTNVNTIYNVTNTWLNLNRIDMESFTRAVKKVQSRPTVWPWSVLGLARVQLETLTSQAQAWPQARKL